MMVIPMICLMLVIPSLIFSTPEIIKVSPEQSYAQNQNLHINNIASDNDETGVLSPVLIEQIGTTAESSSSARTDVSHSPSSSIFLPSGATGNHYSSDCTGGYF
jgi:hypothetical protein